MSKDILDMYLSCVLLTVYCADAIGSSSVSNNCATVSLADSGLLRTSSASSSSHAVTVVTGSRHLLTESVGHCVERPVTMVDSERVVGNCVPSSSSSLSNHSSSLRGIGPALASTAVPFSSSPLLKSAGSAIHRMESVPRCVILLLKLTAVNVVSG